jgi:glycosyltransferase involved in cell wall biosynthesis
MNSQPQDSDALRVMVVTPLGQGGAGGIDRVVDQLRVPGEQNEGAKLTFVVSRGTHVVGSLSNIPWAAARIAIGALTRSVDVVHLNLGANASTYRKFILSLICRMSGLPYVIHLHGSRFHKFWPSLPAVVRGAVDSFFRHAGSIIVLGEVWRDMVVSHVPETADRIFVVANATRRRARSAGSGAVPNILFLGRLGERKGVPDLLLALAKLPAGLPWTATIAGDGEIHRTRQQAGSLGIEDRLTIPGWVGPEDVERLIGKADILVLPSYDENLPMSVIEGMAAGLAVVATPVGATPEVIKDGVTGLLVDPGDIAGLQEALQTLAGDAALRMSLGRAAQAFHHEKLDAGTYSDRLLVPWAHAAAVNRR